jgi:dTDP-4-dehydrorhamnose reductase
MSEEQSRILLIGASGQVGTALAAQFSGEHLVTASHSHARPDDIRVDLSDQIATRQILDDLRPDVVLVAGAMCNAEQCEVDPDACESVNALGPATVAEYARDSTARVVFFSSDHVFDGARERYVESDPPSPINAYARSKAYAEALIRELLPDQHGWRDGRGAVGSVGKSDLCRGPGPGRPLFAGPRRRRNVPCDGSGVRRSWDVGAKHL